MTERTEEYLNETYIIFNNKWKQYIKKASLVFELNLYRVSDLYRGLDLGDCDVIEHFATIQERMRKYLNTNRQYDIGIKNLRKQENFAFGVSMITNIDDCNNWMDVSAKFKIKQNYNREIISTAENYYDETDYELDATNTNCLCNHSVSSTGAYRLTDLYTGKSIMLGCDCIAKTGVISKEELKILKQQQEIQKKLRKERILNSKLTKKDKIRILKNTKLKIKKLTPTQLKTQEEDDCNKEKYEMGLEDVYSQHIRKTELDKIKKRDLLNKWKGVVKKAINHNNKIFRQNVARCVK